MESQLQHARNEFAIEKDQLQSMAAEHKAAFEKVESDLHQLQAEYQNLDRELDRQPDQAHRDALLNAMRNGSVATYAHFNLHGEFDFSPERMVDSVGLWSPYNPSPNGH